MPEQVVILGVGMLTAVGLTARETAASVRGRVARFGESAIRDRNSNPFTLAEVPDDGLPALDDTVANAPLTGRERRMVRLASKPLRECLAALPPRSTRIGLSLALPEAETAKPLDRRAFLTHLARQTDGCFDPAGSDASHSGRAGGITAIGQAVLTIQQGIADVMIAGGVDSYRDAYVLGTLELEERVKTDLSWDGFIPGEGAGFLLLGAQKAASRLGMPTLGTVTPVSMGFEEGHLYSKAPYRGDGLAQTFQQLVSTGVVDAPIGEVYSSMTGESHWAKEWGVAHLRSRAAFREDCEIHHPADCYGDVGAASGPLMAGLASLGMRERYRRSPSLVYGSSDRGARAATIVSM